MSSKPQKSLDEYEKAVKILEQKFLQLYKQNQILKKQYEIKRTFQNQKYIEQNNLKIIEYAQKVNQCAIKIQKIFRGFLQRKKFTKYITKVQDMPTTLLDIQKISKKKKQLSAKDIKELQDNTNKENLKRDRQVIYNIYDILNKKGLSLEMIYRCLDKDYKGNIKLQDYIDQINKIVSDKEMPQNQKHRLFFLLDEECTGELKQVELYKCLASYGLPSEAAQSRGSDRSFEQEMLLRFAFYIRKKKMSAQEIYQAMDMEGQQFVTPEQIQELLKQMGWQFSRKEFQALMINLDIDNTGKISEPFFVNLIDKVLEHNILDFIFQKMESQKSKKQIIIE